MNEVVMIGGMMLVTFGMRYPTLALVGKLNLPPQVLRALKFVPPAVLAAIIAPAVFLPQEDAGLQLALSNAHLLGGLAAVLMMRYTKNLLLTIVFGMAAFWLAQWLISLA
ncbi:MAG: AzlD domain-containing protein [Chloroflexi bacterium]|nr:MAG: AzlD domain-containing protein [Chloroflexota bacterium]